MFAWRVIVLVFSAITGCSVLASSDTKSCIAVFTSPKTGYCNATNLPKEEKSCYCVWQKDTKEEGCEHWLKFEAEPNDVIECELRDGCHQDGHHWKIESKCSGRFSSTALKSSASTPTISLIFWSLRFFIIVFVKVLYINSF